MAILPDRYLPIYAEEAALCILLALKKVLPENEENFQAKEKLEGRPLQQRPMDVYLYIYLPLP